MSWKSLFGKIHGGKENDDTITIVSGLPRSGTSMMMRMLEAGGMGVVTDNTRKPDEDNPRGYYELEKVKRIQDDSSWLGECRGKAVKMISELLRHLPRRDGRYRVVFVRRDLTEILASQRAMLERSGKRDDGSSDEAMAASFQRHLETVTRWLATRRDIQVLYVDYNQILADPRSTAQVVNAFLGGHLNAETMASVVEAALYRQRR